MKKKILFVAPLACYPSFQGNSARMASVYEQLVDMGHDVYYLHLPESEFDAMPMVERLHTKYIYQKYRYNTLKLYLLLRSLLALVLHQKSRRVKIDDFISNRNISFYKKTLDQLKPDAVWVNHVYYSKLFNYTPVKTLKVLDTIDSVYLRFNSIFKDRPGYRSLSVTLADEIACINRADHVICIQQNETDFFKTNGCIKPVSTLGHIINYKPTALHRPKTKLLYLATNYFIYKDAINEFLMDVWPQLIAAIPTAELYIAGKVCADMDPETLPAGVTLLGVVDYLHDLYDKIDVSINPVKHGSGLKIKTIESLAFGKPIITTLAGKDGLDAFEEQGIIVANNTQQWVAAITCLFDNDVYYNSQIFNLDDNIARYNEANIAILGQLFHY